MAERSTGDQASGWLALAVSVVAIASLVSLVLLFAAGEPFGFANDVGNALIGILSALLAWQLVATRGMGIAAVGAAVIGAVVSVIGSWLVITDTTGFFLAGLVSSVGFALIGACLLATSWSAQPACCYQVFARLAGSPALRCWLDWWRYRGS
jgi:hypothetical protein